MLEVEPKPPACFPVLWATSYPTREPILTETKFLNPGCNLDGALHSCISQQLNCISLMKWEFLLKTIWKSVREEKESVICVEKRTWASPEWKKWRMASQGRLYTIFLKLSQPGFLCVRESGHCHSESLRLWSFFHICFIFLVAVL